MSADVPIACELGLIGCDVCGLVLRVPGTAGQWHCPRCAHTLHVRKPFSVQRTLAWLVVALALYAPANLLPVMSTTSVLGHASHTIGGGIVELWRSGSHELALIVFIASIVVPLGKIASLALLAFSAQRGSHWRQRERAMLYRLVETVGHWSMLDVFVVVLLVGMVRFGVLATVEPEAGLLAFGAVVVATMLAASSFDPRLIWPARRGRAESAVDAERARHG
jgi:paraquat-inducible protein A